MILAPLFFYKFAAYVNLHKEGKGRYNILVLLYFLILVLIALINIRYFVFVYLIPIIVFSYVDFLFNQSEHYGYSEKDYSNKHRALDANNIEIPFALGWIFLFRNYHQLHHKYPKIKWYDSHKFYVNDFSKRDYCKSESFFSFFKRFFVLGIRVWPSEFK